MNFEPATDLNWDARSLDKSAAQIADSFYGSPQADSSKSRLKSFSIETLRQKVQGGRGLAFAALLLALPAAAQLTVTPTRSVTTSAGTGALGYTGDNAAATSATLASPSAVAYDAAGNIYLADAQNNVIREITKAGVITTIAGTGAEGYAGDGAAATAALLDTPTGIAVDAAGNIYVADSHNNAIRKISAGTITTIAGTGKPGYSGDGAAATAALLNDPIGVAVDSTGNIYIADTNNHRIRKVTGTTISTIAGDGEQLYAGDGGSATVAALDSPTGVAVDSTGNVYIADRHNQRIRVVSGGTITTLAGSGASSFSGGFSGDGSTATAATLSKPTGVSVDAAGNVYIADTGNQRIRQIGNGAITTIVGSGAQGFGGDGTAPTSVNLNMPKSVAPDAQGNLTVADKLNERLRAAALPTLTFAATPVAIQSTPQSVTLTNSSAATITVSSVAFTGAFTLSSTAGTCSTVPVTLAAGASCTENIAYLPVATGAATGNVVFGGTNVVPQTILLAGSGTQNSTTITLVSSNLTPFIGQPVTFTAQVKPTSPTPIPTGNVLFMDGTLTLATVALTPTNPGVAVFATSALAAGTHNITAVYVGDANYTTSASSVVSEFVADFSFSLSATSPGGSTQTVQPGQAATYSFNVTPVVAPFNYPITLSAAGLPVGATVTFTPQTLTLGGSTASFTMVIQTPVQAMLRHTELYGSGLLALGMLLMPFSRRMRKKARGLRALQMLLGIAMLGSLTGCGTSSGFFAQPSQSYTITITGTATNPTGTTLSHSSTVTLVVQ